MYDINMLKFRIGIDTWTAANTTLQNIKLILLRKHE